MSGSSQKCCFDFWLLSQRIKSDDADPGKYSLEPLMKVVSSPELFIWLQKVVS
jgi:hypothetical protein